MSAHTKSIRPAMLFTRISSYQIYRRSWCMAFIETDNAGFWGLWHVPTIEDAGLSIPTLRLFRRNAIWVTLRIVGR